MKRKHLLKISLACFLSGALLYVANFTKVPDRIAAKIVSEPKSKQYDTLIPKRDSYIFNEPEQEGNTDWGEIFKDLDKEYEEEDKKFDDYLNKRDGEFYQNWLQQELENQELRDKGFLMDDYNWDYSKINC